MCRVVSVPLRKKTNERKKEWMRFLLSRLKISGSRSSALSIHDPTSPYHDILKTLSFTLVYVYSVLATEN